MDFLSDGNLYGVQGISQLFSINPETGATTSIGSTGSQLWLSLTRADPVIEVAIDIKPGSDLNSINLSSNGVVPVAILGSATFDATQVDPATVRLGGAPVKRIGNGYKYSVNADGFLDLVCHVMTADLVIGVGDSNIVLEAQTFTGQAIRGEDSIKMVP